MMKWHLDAQPYFFYGPTYWSVKLETDNWITWRYGWNMTWKRANVAMSRAMDEMLEEEREYDSRKK